MGKIGLDYIHMSHGGPGTGRSSLSSYEEEKRISGEKNGWNGGKGGRNPEEGRKC